MHEAKIIYKNGYPFFKFDNKEYSPCMFRSFRPTPANVSLAYRNGVRVFQMQVAGQMNGMDVPYSLYGGVWQDENVYNFKNFDRQIEMFKKFAPDGKYIVFIQLDAPEAWLEKHKNSISSFYNLHTEAYDEEWKKAAAEYLKVFMQYCEENYGGDIIGYGISAGRSTEWFSGNNYYTENMRYAYAGYLKKPDAQIPGFPEKSDDYKVFRGPATEEYRFLKFANRGANIAAEFFAGEAQKVLRHQNPLGLFGGYYALKDNSLHVNDFIDVWDCGDIDMVWAPASYDEFRKLENSCGVTVACESVKLRNMVHVSELDHRTELACYPMEHPVARERWNYRMLDGNIIDDCCKDSFEAIMLFRRELASALMHGSMLWWFDFFGGYYASPEYENMLKQHVEIYSRIAENGKKKESVAEVAVFADPHSNSYLADAMKIHKSFNFNCMLNLAKSGIAYDIYNLQDIAKVDMSRYKLCIFLNAFRMSGSELEAAKNAECYKLWVYAPNCIKDNRIDYRGIREVTGMNTEAFEKPLDDTVVAGEIKFGFDKPVSPGFYVNDSSARCIGKYEKSGLCAMAYKNGNYYVPCGNIPSELWRMTAKKCGVHVYSECDGALLADNNFICFQTMNTSTPEIRLKEDGVFEELFDGGIYKSENKVLKYETKPGTVKMFVRIPT